MTPAILFWVVLALSPGTAESEPLPWAVGDTVAPHWTVETVDRHAEFVRFELVGQGGARTGLEIVPAPAEVGPFDTERYRVQALPGESPPVALVERAVATLRALEARPGHRPFVEVLFKVARPVGFDMDNINDVEEARAWQDATVALVLLALCVLLGTAVGISWLRRRGPPAVMPRPALLRGPRASTAWVGLAGLALIATTATLLSPHDLPLDLITGMHEGGTFRNVHRIYGALIHSGPVYQALVGLLRAGPGETLRNVVFMNVHLEALAVLGVLLMGRHLLGTWPRALIGAVVWSIQLPVLHAAFSELPAALLHAIAVFALPAAAIVAAPRPARSANPPGDLGLRLAALAQLLLCALLIIGVRPDMGAVAVPAALIGVVCALGQRDLLQRASAAIARSARAVVARPLSLRAGLIVVAALGLWALEILRMGMSPGDGGLPYEVQVALAGLSPFNLSFMDMPLHTARFVTPGILALCLAGVAVGLLRWISTLGLAYGAIVLWRTHFYAAHETSTEELLRYSTYSWPVLAALALVGWREVAAWLGRSVRSARARQAVVGVVAVAVVVPGPQIERGGPARAPHATTGDVLMSRDVQIETRTLVELVERYPSCVFVTRAVRGEQVDERITTFTYLTFGADLSRPLVALETRGPASMQAIRHMLGDRCGLFYQGLDCNRLASVDCAAESHGLVPVWEQVFAGRPYAAIQHSGGYLPQIRLALYAEPPVTPPGASGGAAPPAGLPSALKWSARMGVR